MFYRCLLTSLAVLLSAWPASQAFAQAEDQDALARRIFSLGSRAYEEESFADAANYFERAFELSGRSELMYNIGISRERNGQREEALRWFERYVEELPDGVRVDEVRVRLDVLRRALAEEDGAEAPPPSPAVTASTVAAASGAGDPAEGGGGSSLPGWVLVGSGGALAVSGAVLLALAGSAASTVEDAPQGTFWVDVEGDSDQADLFSVLGATGIALGGAMAAGGLVWALLAGSGEEAPGPELVFGPTSVTLKERF